MGKTSNLVYLFKNQCGDYYSAQILYRGFETACFQVHG